MISKYKIVRKSFLSFLSGWIICMYILTRRIPTLEFSSRKFPKYRLCIFGNNDLGPLLSLSAPIWLGFIR
jgi:hypothetical protein